ncbi:MAG: HDIG domain-containing protein [Synergistaceae bacterium]|nr:HDIG domain-containing protein [Synergistaceae bacterium]
MYIGKKSIFQRIDFKLITKYIFPVFVLLIAGVALVLAQWAVLNKRGNSFKVGEPSPESYRVISQMRYDDYEAAKALRKMVSDSVAGVTVRDVSAKVRLQRRLETLRDMKDLETARKSSATSAMPDGLLIALLKLNTENKARIFNLAYSVGSAFIDRLEAEKVYRANNALMMSILWEEIHKQVQSSSDANFVYQILAGLGNLNFRVDEDLTELAKTAAMDSVPVIDRKLEPGDVIINKGDIVTEQTAILLRLQGYTEDVFPISQLCIVLACVIALPMWLNILGHGSGDNKPSWWCSIFVIITAWVSETLAARLEIHGAGTLAPVVVSYLCVQNYAGFCLALIAASSGVYIITSQTLSNSMILSMLAVFASTLGFYLLRNLEGRRQVSRRVMLMAFILTIFRMTLRYFEGPPLVQDNFRLFIPLGEFWQEAGLFMISEMALSYFFVIILPYVEPYIDTLSILSLREVSYPSSPLLRDLQRNAPGTYQHCLTIATLIEAVGAKLRMDVNLLRAGAYYHDIGKLRKPHYFVENQGGGVNVHDEMSPMLSSMTIISHVRDGLELAIEANLPKRIRDFIAEHHGTTCTRYFYNKAVAMGENVEWSSFCYPGPAPRSRETALLMITDSVEAAVRAANIRELESEDSNRGKGQAVSTIEKIVNQVVASKINEKQFDNVNFTQKDFAVIKETLIDVLMSMYHTRKVKKIESRK